MLRLSVACLRKWRWKDARRVRKGEVPVGPPWRKLGRAVRYPRWELLNWVESQPSWGGSLR
jgi:hypothetical protein